MTLEHDAYRKFGKKFIKEASLPEEQNARGKVLIDNIWQLAHPQDAGEQRTQESELRKYYRDWENHKGLFVILWSKAGGDMALLSKVIGKQA